MHPVGVANVCVYPPTDLIHTVSLETHPDLERTEAPSLLEAVYIVLIAVTGDVKLIGEVGRLESKRSPELCLVLYQQCTSINGEQRTTCADRL